jgi:dihydropteroate synthase
MAVVNISKESFYPGSFIPNNQLTEKIKGFCSSGADFIDIGARSTAPWSEKISIEEEKKRLKNALELILPEFPREKILSIDTQYSDVARLGLETAEAEKVRVILNDVSNLKTDPKLGDLVVEYQCPIVLMASKKIPGDALTMNEIIESLKETASLLQQKGLGREKIIADPGVGKWIDGRTPEFDSKIISELENLRVLGLPILMALSRKSFIGALLHQKNPDDRYFGSVAATSVSVFNGAHIIRTHDVNTEMVEVIKLSKILRDARSFL